MTSSVVPSSLAGEFPAVEHDRWLGEAARALVRNLAPDADRASIVGTLRSKTYDGITIEPLYTGSASEGDHDGFPGFSPFVRGRTADGTRSDGWEVRQIVDAASAEFTAVHELECGATSVWLDVRGLEAVDANALAKALDGVYLELTSVNLDAGSRWVDASEALLQLWASKGISDAEATGSFGVDPVGEFASSGGGTEISEQLALATALTKRLASSHPRVRVITVDGTRFHAAGAADGQELGFSLAVAVATLRAFEAADLDLATAFRQIELRFAATADQFSTIAKFRAARRLWSRIADVAGIPEAAGHTPIHAVTSVAMMSRYDPWVNLLRTTIACFGAGIGGADAITVLPYDIALDPAGSELGRRIARNTQSILSKESNLSRVIDPSGGSWYVESLTDQLAEAAWSWFQQVEAAGGVEAAVTAGLIANLIDDAWIARRRNIVTRRDPLTGVSEFPNVLEAPPAATDETNEKSGPSSGLPFALVPRRLAEPFEALRARVDRSALSSGSRPSVFLANLGAPAVHTARASFAKNLFEIAGVLTIPGPGSTDPDELAAQFVSSGARVACICSSDALYERLGLDVARALHAANPEVLYLAGRPRDLIDPLTAAGVDGFIAAGSDVEQTLSDLLHRLDVR